MIRVKFVLVALALMVVMVAGSAPAMAQEGWDDDYWHPGWGYYGYYDDYYDDAYDEFEEGCTGLVSGGECIGVGSDLDEYYSDDYYDYLDDYYYDYLEDRLDDYYDYLDEYYD